MYALQDRMHERSGGVLGAVEEAGVAYLHKTDAKRMEEMRKIKSALLKHRYHRS